MNFCAHSARWLRKLLSHVFCNHVLLWISFILNWKKISVQWPPVFLLYTLVLIFCVEFLELSQLIHDLSQTEKKIAVVTSWATDKMSTIFTQNDNFDHFEWNRCHFEHLLRLYKHLFSSQFEISHVLNGTTHEIQHRKSIQLKPKFKCYQVPIGSS